MKFKVWRFGKDTEQLELRVCPWQESSETTALQTNSSFSKEVNFSVAYVWAILCLDLSTNSPCLWKSVDTYEDALGTCSLSTKLDVHLSPDK